MFHQKSCLFVTYTFHVLYKKYTDVYNWLASAQQLLLSCKLALSNEEFSVQKCCQTFSITSTLTLLRLKYYICHKNIVISPEEMLYFLYI